MRSANLIKCVTFALFASFSTYAADKQAPPIDTSGQVSMGGKTFITGKEEGWFWKKDPPEPLEPPEEIAQEPEVTPPEEKEKPPVAPPASPQTKVEEQPAFSVAWFRDNIQKLRDRAIDNPTQENVRAYYLAQRVMLDKASRFTDMARLVTSTDPLIDESGRRSTSTFGAMGQSSDAEKMAGKVSKQIAQKAGIFFFFKGEDCSVCLKQASVLKTFSYMTGMKIIPISLDGKPLAGGLSGWRPDTGQADKLQIKNAPALALAIPPSQARILSFGPISADQLTSRVILIAHDAGMITDSDYKSTLPYNDNGYIDSDVLKDMPQDYLSEPNEFIKFIQEKSGYASPAQAMSK